jgi:hypothetical protein
MAGENPYAAPQARVADAPAGRGSVLKALALGLLVDLGGTFAVGLVLGMVGLFAIGMSPEEVTAAANSTDSWLFYVGGAAGLACSVLGGYVCARVAGRSELKLGAVLAGLSAVAGGLIAFDEVRLGTFLALTLLGIGAVLAGARWGAARNRSP